jgi:hypothetical protein
VVAYARLADAMLLLPNPGTIVRVGFGLSLPAVWHVEHKGHADTPLSCSKTSLIVVIANYVACC